MLISLDESGKTVLPYYATYLQLSAGFEFTYIKYFDVFGLLIQSLASSIILCADMDEGYGV